MWPGPHVIRLSLGGQAVGSAARDPLWAILGRPLGPSLGRPGVRSTCGSPPSLPMLELRVAGAPDMN